MRIENMLVIWELIPEESAIFHLKNVEPWDFDKIKSCHGHYLGLEGESSEMEENLNWLSNFLVDKERIYDSKVHLSKQFPIIEITEPVVVVHTGQIL